MKLHRSLCLLVVLCGSLITFGQVVSNEYDLGHARDINVLTGRVYDNGGKTGNIGPQHFVTTLHGTHWIEVYFERYKLPDGAMLKFYNGNDTLSPLLAAFRSFDKIYNVQAKDITVEYLPPANNVTPAFGFEGVVREIAPPGANPRSGPSRSQAASDCPGAIPLCQNLTAVALGGMYTDLGAINDDGGSCYGGTGSGGSVWYSFQPQSNGPLDFTITPTGTTDYDFVVWDISAGCGTGQRQEISCNFSQYTDGTGLSSINCNEPYGTCTTNDCSTDSKGSDCNRFNRRPNVLSTHHYAVCINFYSGSNDGFDIQFKNEPSSVNITDIIPPTIINASASSCPTASQFNLRFSEYCDCSTIQASDLTLPGHTITLNSINCTGNSTNNIDISVSPPLTSGTYSLHAQDIADLCGNIMNSNFSIVIGPTPNPTISPDATTCRTPGFLGIGYTYSPATQTLTAGGGSFYVWSDGQTGTPITVSPTATTTYTVTVTQGACPATASVTVNVESITVNVPDATICAGGSTVLTASGGGTYQWYTAPTLFGNGTAIPAPQGTAASYTASPTTTTKYRVIVTSPHGCTAQDDATVTVATTGCCNATITPAGPFCNSITSTTLTAGTSGGTWSGTGITNAAAGTFSPSTVGAGTYKVYYTLSCGALDSTTIVVQTCTALTVCRESNGNVTASGGIAPYSWQHQTTTTDCSACPGGNCIPFLCAGTTVTQWTTFATTPTTAPGTFPIQVVDNGGTIVSIPTLASLPLCSSCPTITVATSSVVNVACNGGSTASFSATATGGASPYNYVLKNGATTVANFSNVSGAQAFGSLAAANYTINVTDANGCTGTNTVNITQPAALVVSIPTSTNASCGLSNGSATSNVTGGTTAYSYSWNNGGGTGPGINAVAANTYTVIVTDANTCTASASVTITNGNTAVNVSIATPAQLTCTNTTVTLTASSTTAGATFAWSGGPTGATNTVNAAGTYTVTASATGSCSVSASVSVSQNIAGPNANAGADAVLNCISATATLTGSSTTAGVNYLWSGPGIVSGGTTTTVSVNTAGTYTLLVTDPANGCTASDAANATPDVNTPNINAGPDQSLTCTVTSVTLTATSTTAGVTYAWSTGPTTASITVSVANTYVVTVTDGTNGCKAIDQVVVADSTTPPNVSAGPDMQLTCVSNSVNLIGSSTTTGVTYLWSNGTPSATTTVTTANTYTLVVTNPSNNCTASDQAVVSVNTTTPNANAGPDGVLTCTVTSITLTATSTSPNTTFSWNNGPATAANAVTTPNTYTVVVTDTTNGCTASDAADVTTSPGTVTANAGSDATITCAVTSVTLTGTSNNANVSYAWSNGPLTATNTVSAANTYILTVTDLANGCQATDQVVVSADVALPNVSAGPDQTLPCGVASVTLTGTSTTTGATFLWSNGPATSDNTVSSANTYTLTVTDPANGCTASDQAVVTNSANAPDITLGPDAVLTCADPSITLIATSTVSGLTYAWSPGGETTGSITVTSAATYAVTVTDPSNNCTAGDDVTITANGLPTLNAQLQNNPCPQVANGAVITAVTGGSTPYSYNWSTGAVTANIIALHGGTYKVTVTDASGCSVADVYVISEGTGPQIDSLETVEIKLGGSVQLNALVSGASSNVTYNWTPYIQLSCRDCNNPIASPQSDITYTVVAIDSNNCTDTAIVFVRVVPDYNVYIPNAFTPNNDGNNDYFEIFGDKSIWREMTITIFNRWGEKVFESNDINFKWDGNYRSQPQNSQVFTYVFKLTFTNGYLAPVRKGSFALIR